MANIKTIQNNIMRKICIFIIILCAIISCKHEKVSPELKSKINLQSTIKKTVYYDSILGYINPKLGLFSFKFTVQNDINNGKYTLFEEY
jgi:hypothetical protein